MIRISTWSGVVVGAVLLTAAVLASISALSFLFLPNDLREATLGKSLIGSGVMATVIHLILFNQIRKNTVLADQLRDLVERDRLTDVATRERFFNAMDATPDAYGVSLMVDIDHFKTVNDTYGHLAGDEVIRQVAGVLRDNLRGNDIVCRYGGEEFVIFLHDHNLAQGGVIAERMRHAVQSLEIAHGGMPLSVTISIGGSMKDRITALDQSISEADRALYCAKKMGRNRIIMSTDCPLVAAQLSPT